MRACSSLRGQSNLKCRRLRPLLATVEANAQQSRGVRDAPQPTTDDNLQRVGKFGRTAPVEPVSVEHAFEHGMGKWKLAVAVMLPLATASLEPALASEMFGGVFAHNVELPTTIGSPEGGVDLQFGARSAPIAKVMQGQLRPFVFSSVNSGRGLNFAAAGLAARFHLGERIYVQPGLGIAVHDGAGGDAPRGDGRLHLGSRVLAELELMLGWRVTDKMSIEAGQVHLSHAKLLGPQNPGLDELGVRLIWKLGK